MDESERSDFEPLVDVLEEELAAQFAILLAESVIDRLRLVDRRPS
jgi:hypothetical protein